MRELCISDLAFQAFPYEMLARERGRGLGRASAFIIEVNLKRLSVGCALIPGTR